MEGLGLNVSNNTAKELYKDQTTISLLFKGLEYNPFSELNQILPEEDISNDELAKVLKYKITHNNLFAVYLEYGEGKISGEGMLSKIEFGINYSLAYLGEQTADQESDDITNNSITSRLKRFLIRLWEHAYVKTKEELEVAKSLKKEAELKKRYKKIAQLWFIKQFNLTN